MKIGDKVKIGELRVSTIDEFEYDHHCDSDELLFRTGVIINYNTYGKFEVKFDNKIFNDKDDDDYYLTAFWFYEDELIPIINCEKTLNIKKVILGEKK